MNKFVFARIRRLARHERYLFRIVTAEDCSLQGRFAMASGVPAGVGGGFLEAWWWRRRLEAGGRFVVR